MKSKFYIDNATPVEMSYTLLCINKDEELNNKDFLERFSEKGFAVGKKYTDNFRRLVDLGALLEKYKGTRKYYSITPKGLRLKNVLFFKEDLFYEVLHYLHYYSSLNCINREYFWTYKFVCDSLYKLGSLYAAPRKLLNPLVEELQTKFGQTRVVIDGRSISKVIQFLRALNQFSPIINSQYIPRKELFEPELLLVAIDYTYKVYGLNYGIPLVLNEQVRETLCYFCLLDRFVLDGYLKYLSSKLYLRSNYGIAGYAIILDQSANIESWLEERFS